MLKKEIDEYNETKRSITEFKEALTDYVVAKDSNDAAMPVVFFIDELDRCNPKYAVRVLERIKHLFNVPNVIFVLSIDKQQLSYAIQGYYGSSKIDSDNYLRRFIDIELTLPEVDSKVLCDYLLSNYGYSDFFNDSQRINRSTFHNDFDTFKRLSEYLISGSGKDIRSIDKIFAHTRFALISAAHNTYIVPDVFVFVCYLRLSFPDIYTRIRNNEYSPVDLLSALDECLPKQLFTNSNKYGNDSDCIIYTIGKLLYMYLLNNNTYTTQELEGVQNTTINLKYIDFDSFIEAFKTIISYHHNFDFGLCHIIDRIEIQNVIIPN